MKIAVIGDTQHTSLWERVFLRREDNTADQQTLIAAMAAENPDLVIHLGDLNFLSTARRLWRRYDELFSPINDRNIQTLLVPGNHDYFGGLIQNLSEFEKRFPHFKLSRWSTYKFGSIALILLDSNKRPLGRKMWRSQADWYLSTINRYETDDEIKDVFVLAHHPPFTNSKSSGEAKWTHKDFVEPFLAKKKTRAYISGHVHAYEHFEKNGKHFLVAGGGGGPRVKLHEGKNAKHADLCLASSPRPLHFILINEDDSSRKVQCLGLVGESITVIDSISL
jgi:Icc-related predicted phosphoesterase